MRDPMVLLREFVSLASNIHPGPRGTYDMGKAGYERLRALVREVVAEPAATPKVETICDHRYNGFVCREPRGHNGLHRNIDKTASWFDTGVTTHEHRPAGQCPTCVKRAKNREAALAELQEDAKNVGLITAPCMEYSLRRRDGQHVTVVWRGGKWHEQ